MESKAKRIREIANRLLHFLCTFLVVVIIGKLIEYYLHGGPLNNGHWGAMVAAALLGTKYSPLVRKSKSKEKT